MQTRAMVMAAGQGTRLRPLTEVVPKPALPVGNEPIMARLLRLLARHGIRDVAVNAHHLAPVMQRVFGDGTPWGVQLTWSVETEIMGTAGGVKRVEAFLREGDERAPALVLSGDGLHDFDLSALLRFHNEREALVTIALVEVEDPSQFGVAVLDADGRVQQFQEKPAPGTELSRLSNAGVYVLAPEVFDRIPEGRMYDFGHELFPALAAERAGIYGWPVDGAWDDVGTIEAYRLANLHVASTETADGLVVAPTAQLGEGSVLEPPVVVGAGARIGAAARVANTVVLPGAVVPDASSVDGDLVYDLDGLRSWADSFA